MPSKVKRVSDTYVCTHIFDFHLHSKVAQESNGGQDKMSASSTCFTPPAPPIASEPAKQVALADATEPSTLSHSDEARGLADATEPRTCFIPPVPAPARPAPAAVPAIAQEPANQPALAAATEQNIYLHRDEARASSSQRVVQPLTGSELRDGRSFESPKITFPKPSLRLTPRVPAGPPPLHLLPCPPAGPPQNILQLPLHMLPCELRDSHLRTLAAQQYDELRRPEPTTHPPSPASSDSDSDILLGYASDSETSSYCSWTSRKCSAKTLRNVTRRKRKRKRSLESLGMIL